MAVNQQFALKSANWHIRCAKQPRVQREINPAKLIGGQKMLWTIFVILLVLWLVGLVSSYTMGGFIHLLLLLAVVVLIINLVSGRRPVV